jgi:hypothetical protein
MTKIKCFSKPIWTLTLILFMLSLASVISPFIPIVQAQGTNQAIITLDDCAGDVLAPAANLRKLDDDQYIGNSRSYIFHHSWCRYVGQMSDSHKVYFDSRDEAIDAGYRPCKVCRP